jgi:acyl-CoA synthetase (AMP-forming)/AMP-acid ligase II
MIRSFSVDPPYGTLVDAFLSFVDGRRPDSRKVTFVIQKEGHPGSQAWSWRDLVLAAKHVATGLETAGLTPGDVVMIGLPTGPDFIIAFIACLFARLLPCAVPIDASVVSRAAPLSPHVQAAMRQFRPRAILTTEHVRGRLHGSAEAGHAMLLVPGELNAPIAMAVTPPSPDELCHIQLTSGSTSAPKAVALSHRAVVSNLHLFERQGSIDHEELSGLHWLPLFHDMGLISMLSVPYYNRDLVLMAPDQFILSPMGWLEAISQHRSRMSGAPNFALAYCVRRFRPELLVGVDLSCLDTLVLGAEKIHLETLQAFDATFAPYGFRRDAFLPCYGLAEVTLAATLPRRRPDMCLGSRVRWDTLTGEKGAAPEVIVGLGEALEGSKIEIRDDDDAVLPEGEHGEVFISSPSLMNGYYGDPRATEAVLRRGFYATGDRGYLRDGELFLIGRIKELIILRGRNYSPHEFEACAASSGKVATDRVAAFGVPDPDNGSEKLVLVIEPDNYNRLGELRQEIQALLRARFQFGASDICFVRKGVIPRTTSRKIQRVDCARLYRESVLPVHGDADPVLS